MDKGKLIVIEGIDGSGKSTQIKLLSKILRLQKIPFEIISFPRYENNLYGKLIRKYLKGEFGLTVSISPYFVSLAYAGDRALAKNQIQKWLQEGKWVLVNRYVSSSYAHMGANLKPKEREEFFVWLGELEYTTNGIPKEDMTILLSVDPRVGQENVSGRHTDIHEQNLAHLKQASEIYLMLAQKNNWHIVDCMVKGKMKSPGEINKDIVKILLGLNISGIIS